MRTGHVAARATDNSRGFARGIPLSSLAFRELAQRSELECLQGGGRGFEPLSAHERASQGFRDRARSREAGTALEERIPRVRSSQPSCLRTTRRGPRRVTPRRGSRRTTSPRVRWRRLGFMQRQSCLSNGCFATFDASPADEGKVRHCNRAGPQGGHAQRWDGDCWKAVVGAMKHDRS